MSGGPSTESRQLTPAVRSAASLLLGLVTGVLSAATPPNILFILADDLGYSDLGAYGSEYPTPAIDSLAHDGARLTDYYTSSTCTPSRFSLLTGMYPNRSHDRLLAPLDYLDPRDAGRGLQPDETTLAELLADKGYRTALIGKWHLGHGTIAFLPNHHGFESYFGYTAGAIDYFTSRYGRFRDLHRNDDLVEQTGYAVDLLADEAVRFLRNQNRDHPFFLYLAQVAPHFGKPWDPATQKAYNALQPKPELYAQLSNIPDERRRQYAALVTSLDECVGRVLAALRESGLAESTLVIFASDNGGARNMGGSNRPFRGQKGTLWEGGIRVPCLVRWPGHVPAASLITEPIHSVDWVPTLCGLAGVDLTDHRLDGRNIARVLAGLEGVGDRPLFWDEVAADRDGGGETAAVRRGPWKFLRLATGEEQLFHLQTDPAEQTNLLARETVRAEELRALLDRWRREIATPSQAVGEG